MRSAKKKVKHGKYSVEVHSGKYITQYMKKYKFYEFFSFVNVIIFVINPCGPYSRFVGVESCVKLCFRSFVSIRSNLWFITYLVRQIYCHCFCCLAVCCLYFLYKKEIQFSSFLKKLKTGLKGLQLNQKCFENLQLIYLWFTLRPDKTRLKLFIFTIVHNMIFC